MKTIAIKQISGVLERIGALNRLAVDAPGATGNCAAPSCARLRCPPSFPRAHHVWPESCADRFCRSSPRCACTRCIRRSARTN